MAFFVFYDFFGFFGFFIFHDKYRKGHAKARKGLEGESLDSGGGHHGGDSIGQLSDLSRKRLK